MAVGKQRLLPSSHHPCALNSFSLRINAHVDKTGHSLARRLYQFLWTVMAVSSLYSIIIPTFFFVFLFSLFCFSKRALEPSLSIYGHFLPQPLTVSSISKPTTEDIYLSSNTTSAAPFPITENFSLSTSTSTQTPSPKTEDFSLSSSTTSNTTSATTPATGHLSQPPLKHPQSVSSIQIPSPTHTQSQYLLPNAIPPPAVTASFAEDDNLLRKNLNSAEKQCDLYTGHWVKDEGYPLYQPGSCPYVDEAFSCQHNGRPDVGYLKWRWQPGSCDLPRFNATDFLERLRGKRLLLVGDSMNRNQFESMLCLLHESLPDKSRIFETRGNKITKGRGYFTFKFMDYNCTIEFCRSHFLVKEGTRLNAKGQSNPTLSIDRIDKSYPRWKHADILIFNTGHWWTHGKTARGKNYYKEGDYLYPKFDAVEAFRRAISTWGKWIDRNVDPKKKLVFYRGYSMAHFRGGDWDSGGTCNGETEPIKNGSFLDTYPPKMQIVEEVIHKMRFPVILLNITKLTNFRKDGHPSVYRKTLVEGRKLSTRRQDCSHWCLPGVPDAWNELIYASLVMKQTPPLS